MKLLNIVLVALLTTAGTDAAAVDSLGTPVAVISNGVIHGTATTLPDAASLVNKFLGIPFAQAGRFEPPSPAANWAQPLNATAFGPSCIQLLSSGASSPAAGTQSEDCLSINVFQPAGSPPPDGWPVLFWIYGGGLSTGSASVSFYDGSAFAAYEEVIVVSFNYRLNVFGFPNAPELPPNGTNLGFQDQRYALQWVQDNIVYFGGNKDKVTVFGESSGAVSVDALLVVPPKPLPFRAAILESGSVIGQVIGTLGVNVTKTWEALVDILNCSSTANVLACVRAVPATTIQTSIQQHGLSFIPVPDNITFITGSYGSRSSGRAAKVPVLAGSNANDGTLFTLGLKNLTAFVETVFSILPRLQPIALQLYAVGTPGIADESQAIAQIYTEIGFQCPAAVLLNQTVAAGNKAWRYLYDATFPNLSTLPNLGVFHSSEIPLVFSTYPEAGTTAQEFALSNYMRGAWAQFARNPAGGPGWNSVGSLNGTDLGVLGGFGSGGVTVIPPQPNLDARCQLYTGLYAAVSS